MMIACTLLRSSIGLVGAAIVLSITVRVGAQTDAPVELAVSSAPPPAGPVWTLGAFVDFGYLHSFNDPLNKLFRSRGTTWHLDQPHLNMAGAYARKVATPQSRWGTEVLVQTGKDDEIFGFSATAPNIAGANWLRHLGPTNASYLAPVGRGLSLQAGIFSSLIGYDSLYAKDNLNYTRPWGADFTPYLMLGVNASYPLTPKLTGTFYVVNGYWHLADANSVPSSGVQLAYKPDPRVTVKESVLIGPHQSDTSPEFWRLLSDTIVERRTDRLTVAMNFNVATERVNTVAPFRAWWASAQLPVRWTVRPAWSVAVRPEVAWDSNGRWTLAEQTVTAVTTTVEYRPTYQGLDAIVRLEHRFDRSRGREGGFFGDRELSPGTVGLKPTQPLLILGVILSFEK